MTPDERAKKAFEDVLTRHAEQYKNPIEKMLLYQALLDSYREYDKLKQEQKND